MNKQCEIARDLMPLCVDEVASEGSREYVEAHMQECETCRDCYEEMKKTLAVQGAQLQREEQTEFAQAADKLKRRHQLRTRKNIVIGAALTLVMVIVVLIGWNALIVRENHEIHTDDYNLVLSQLSDGRVVVTIDYMDSRRAVSLRMSTTRDPMTDDQYATSVWLQTSIIPKWQSWTNQTGELSVITDISRYSKISVGREVKKGIWQQGDPIAPASEEMEEYYRVEAELNVLRAEREMTQIYRQNGFVTEENVAEEDEIRWLTQRLGALREIVPEWQ